MVGGGLTGFPAIVSRFYLQTRPLPEMYQSIYFWPISEYKKVLQWVIDVRITTASMTFTTSRTC